MSGGKTPVNLNGEGVIAGQQEYKGRHVADRYFRTPVFDPAVIPAGRQAHIGEGVWRTVCAEPGCGVFVDNYGAIGYAYELAKHEAAHGRQVPGYNVALLA